MGYKIAFWNCRRKLISDSQNDTNKLVDIKTYVQKHSPHVLGVIESDIHSWEYQTNRTTRYSTSEVKEKLKIEGYDILFPDTWVEHGQARLIVYVSEHVQYKRRVVGALYRDLPHVTLEIGLGKERKTLVNIFYREWTSGVSGLGNQASQIERLERQISYWQTLYDEDRDLLLCGDANLCAFAWNENDFDSSKKILANMIQDQLLENSSVQIVQDFTRSELYGGTVSQSCIDHVYTNCPSKCDKPRVESAGDSDHLAVLVTKYTRELKSKPHTVLKRNYKNFDLGSFLNDVRSSSINQDILQCNDIETAAKIFQEQFGQILNKHAPVKIFQCRTNYVPYLSDETKILMKERDTLKEEATKHACETLFAEYKIKRNEVKARLGVDETDFYKNKFHDVSLNIRKIWKIVYNILGQVDNKAPSKIREGNKIISNPKNLADTFNKLFKDKVKKLRTQTTTDPKINPTVRLQNWLDKRETPIPDFSLQPIDMSQLRNILKKIKPSRSHGIDFIDANSIKVSAPLIEESLLHMVNLSITSAKFASLWKIQLVLPLHKKNDKMDGSNYRPVSHIIELGKIVEYAIHQQVYQHFVLHDLFHSNHHGFLGDHSTATALIQLQDLWLSAAEETKLSAALLLDLSAAFDIVDHGIFLDKLRRYKFSEETVEWFSSYLKDRKQVVQVESKYSDPEEIGEHGVPQGSILGPLIFIIFNNDFPANSEEGVSVLYADDDTANVSDDDPEELKNKIQREADRSTEWVSDNRMVCSGEKTKLLIIGTPQLRKSRLLDRDISIQINVCGMNVKESKSEKLLGLVVNNQLTWTEYLYGESWREEGNAKGLIPQLSQRVGLLRRIGHLMPKQRFNTVCQGIFNSKMIYCLQVVGNVWGMETTDEVNRRYSAFTKEDNRKMQTLQNKVIRLKTGLPHHTPTETLLKISGDLSVQQLTAFSTLTSLKKVIHKQKPKYLVDKLKINTNTTRQENNIRMEAKLTVTRGAYFYRAASLYNSLPIEMRNLDPISFKPKVKSWIKANIPPKPS